MTDKEANAIEILKAYRQRLKDSPSNLLEADIEAFDMAIKAVEQIERISKLVDDLDLAYTLPKDFDDLFYLQSVKEIKEEMWRMYCFAEDVKYNLMAESEDKE